MANNRWRNRDHHVSPEGKEAENCKCDAGANRRDRYNPSPFAQFQHANRQTDGDPGENQQRQSTCDSHAGECSRDPPSRVSVRRCHDRNEKERERAESENRCSEERQNRDGYHTGGAFHVFTFSQAIRVTNAPVRHSSSKFCPSGLLSAYLRSETSYLIVVWMAG